MIFWPALVTSWRATTGNRSVGASEGIFVSKWEPDAGAGQLDSQNSILGSLLTQNTVLLGKLHDRTFHVSLDDIESDGYLRYIDQGQNALVISVYDDGADSALRRAVLMRLRETSPEDYEKVHTQLVDSRDLQVGSVLQFALSIPQANRHLFPVDYLIAVVFKKGPSGEDGFEWVAPVCQIAANHFASNLIVPCLGRNWRDKRTIEFDEFFSAFLGRIPSGDRPQNVYFSLYAAWPSFELEDASDSLNRVWRSVG
jgi:hypothetical protein